MLTTHHIRPQSRGGGETDNLVLWNQAFHRHYHTLFENLTLEEVHILLDILAFAPKAWGRTELAELRRGLKHNALPVVMANMRSAIVRDDRPPTGVRFHNRETYNEAFRFLFRGMPWAARHELLETVSTPGSSWSFEKIMRFRHEVQDDDSFVSKWTKRCIWTRSGAHRLQEKIRKIRDRKFNDFLTKRNMATP